MPAAARRSSAWSISGLPATRTIGLGWLAVSGRIRLPSPAASTIAASEANSNPEAVLLALTAAHPRRCREFLAEYWRRTTPPREPAPDVQGRAPARPTPA